MRSRCCLRMRSFFVRVLALLAPLWVSVDSVAGQLKLAWDPVTDATGYRLHYGTVTGKNTGTYTTSIDVQNNTTVTVPGLTDGTRYFFAVKAYNVTTTSDFSNEVDGVPATSPSPFPPDTTPPAQPQGLRIR